MKKRSMKLMGLTLATVGLALSGGVMAHASKPQVESQGGIKIFNAEDSAYWFSVGGRLNLDETQFSGNTLAKRGDFPSGGNIRRAFLKLAGGVGDYLTYNFTLDFSGDNGKAGTNGSVVQFEDAFVNACTEYTGPLGVANLRFGQFTPPTSIDSWGNYGTQNDTVFLESALATQAFATPGKVFGVWGDVSALDTVVLSAAVYQPRQASASKNVSDNNYGNASRSDKLGTSLRLTVVPVHTEDRVLHLGAMGRYQSMNHQASAGAPLTTNNLFSAGPEARARNTAAVVTTSDFRAKSYNVVSTELLGIYGPAMLEAEYHRANVQRIPATTPGLNYAGNVRFNGWHVQGGYLLTGESRHYDFATGTLRNPTPAAKSGAWKVNGTVQCLES